MDGTRLDIKLVELGLYESRARAASAIKTGHVKIDGKTATKPSQKVANNNIIEAEQEHPWVSRAGIKLAHALKLFNIDVSGKTCLDVGSSTGGFTEVLLDNGARKIYAVDVGQGQLHNKLKGHPKVVSMEQTDARTLRADMFDPLPQIVVCDASFISATKILEKPLSIVQPGAVLISLVKPQFEVGRENIGRGGLVKTEELAKKALTFVVNWVSELGWEVRATNLSPIKGGDGNIEYLLYARK
ncbi:MAG: TlyA family RNA methyltransferase [Hellea sp.]|nr:TlyA family RNA methyltransferase [Hellea sp.]